MFATQLPLPGLLCGLLVASVPGAAVPAQEPWPTREVYDLILAGRERNTLEVEVFRACSAHRGSIVLSGDLSGVYDFMAPEGNLFPEKIRNQFGRYALKLDEQQFRAALGILRDSRFSSLKHPDGLVHGTLIMLIRLRYAGRHRFVRFPVGRPIPPDFQKTWDALIGVFARCEITAQKALGLNLTLPRNGTADAPLAVDLRIRNVGREEVAIPNPASTAREGRLRMTFRIWKRGAAAKPEERQFGFGAGGDQPASLVIPPSDDVRIHDGKGLHLKEPGEYSVVARVAVALPRGPDEKKGIVGTMASNECRVTIK